MKFVVDRVEGEYVIVEKEDGDILDLPIEILPENFKEGDILEIKILEDETDNKKMEIEDKLKSLFIDD